jgi:hypothetical protein
MKETSKNRTGMFVIYLITNYVVLVRERTIPTSCLFSDGVTTAEIIYT